MAEAVVVRESAGTREAALSVGERLVNLTEHEVVLVARPQGGGEGVAGQGLARFSPDGRFARVDDVAARIPVDLAKAGPFTVHVAPSLADRVIPIGPRSVQVEEWRLAARTVGADRVPDLPWGAFPAAAEAIADWVVARAAAHPGVVLLATRVPQELSVGLGIQLGQRSADRMPGQRWPRQVYPVFYADDDVLVIPDLKLGSESVPAQRG